MIIDTSIPDHSQPSVKHICRLSLITAMLMLDPIAHAEPLRMVVTVPAYPRDDMPDKDKVMATLASYALWPAEERPVAPSQLYAEYEKYCKARWALTAWNLRDSDYFVQIAEVRKELYNWSSCLAPVSNSRTGCVSGAYYREYWANEMKLEDAIAATADNLPKSGDDKWKVEQRSLDRLEWMVRNITPFERNPGATEEDDPVNAKDFAKNKLELVKATQRLSARLKELPATSAYPLLEEIRRTLATLND
jgi:hypothetical protein